MAADGEGSAWRAGSIRMKIQQWESLDGIGARAAPAPAKRPTLFKQQSLRRLEETSPETKETLPASVQRSVNQSALDETCHEPRTRDGNRQDTKKHSISSSFEKSEVIVRPIDGNFVLTERAVISHRDNGVRAEAAEIRVDLAAGETEVETPPRQSKKAIEESGPELHAPELVALLLGRGGCGGGMETNAEEVEIVDTTKDPTEKPDKGPEADSDDDSTSEWHFVEDIDFRETTAGPICTEPEAETEAGHNNAESSPDCDTDAEIDSGRMSRSATALDADEQDLDESDDDVEGVSGDEVLYTTDMVGPCMMATDDSDSGSAQSSSSTSASTTPAVATPPTVDYHKVKGHATLKADWCEVKLASLLYLRGINAKRPFRIATSVAGAGAFGDIVFKYKTDTWKTCFIQLKHKSNATITSESLTAVDGSFSLAEDFQSFCEIRDRMRDDADEDLFRGSFADCSFVLHTNATLSERLASRRRPGVNGDLDKFLRAGLNDDRVLRLDADTDKDVYSAMGAEFADFLAALAIFSGQPSEIEMDHLVKMELRGACSKYLSNVHIIYRFFVEAVQQWWTNDPNYLTQKMNVLDKAENILNVYNLTARQKLAFRLHDVSFREAHTAAWKAELRKANPLLCIVTTGLTSKFSCTKLMQALREDAVEYIFTSLAHAHEVIDEWTCGQKDVLVVVSEASSEEEDALCAELCAVFQRKPCKQLVLVSPPCNAFVASVQANFRRSSYEELYDPFDIAQLDKDTTDQLLEREIRLQGYPIFLKCVIGEDLTLIGSIFSSDNFDTLVDCQAISIGKEVPARVRHYVRRSLERRDVFTADILAATDLSGVVAVSNITVDELEALAPAGSHVGQASDPNAVAVCKFLVLDSFEPALDFVKVCEARDDAVLWLRRSKDKLVWKRSRQEVAVVARYMEATVTRYQPATVMDLDDRVIVVVGDVCTGKSTLTSHLALETKQNDPSMWVIVADLGKCGAFFEETPLEEIRAVEFLSALQNEPTDFLGIDLLNFCADRLGNVAVFVDGFDEVVSRYRDKVMALLAGLVETRVGKIFITCDGSEQDLLERRLFTLAYRLSPEERVQKVIEENARESFV